MCSNPASKVKKRIILKNSDLLIVRPPLFSFLLSQRSCSPVPINGTRRKIVYMLLYEMFLFVVDELNIEHV